MKKSTSQALSLALVFCLCVVAPAMSAPQQQQQQRATPVAPPPATSRQSQQQQPAPDETQDETDDDVVRITANLVQLDVVVLDREGRQVTDLRPEDFEIFEDGKRQPITNFSYVALNPAPVAPADTAAAPVDKTAPPIPPRNLRPEQVRRTLALVVDDLGLSFDSMAYVRRALKRFVDEQMQPNDIVAIIRTSAGMSALQQFTSDKRMLHSVIDRLRWYPRGRGGLSTFAPAENNAITREMEQATSPAATSASNDAAAFARMAATEQREFQREAFTSGTLGSVNFVINGLRDLPGRKSILMFSDGFALFTRNLGHEGEVGHNDRVMEQLRRLTDQANRASVVIYTIDPRGLQPLNLTAEDSVSGQTRAQVQTLLDSRTLELYDTQQGLELLARQTGGFSIRNSNNITGGVRRVLDDQKGFYLIGYRPDSQTFAPMRGRGRFHNVTAKVKRAGLNVRTRNGFYGFADAESRPSTAMTRGQLLVKALMSPFSYGGVQLHLTSLFGNAEEGSFATSLLHVDPQHISLVAEPDGWHKAVVDMVALTFGENGVLVDQLNRTETMRLRGAAYEQFLRHGFVYVMKVPVKKPGAYQLRVAVRDTASERVGSASQFIEIPDLKKNRLALSGIIMMNTAAQPATAASSLPPAVAAVTTAVERADTFNASLDATLRQFRRGASVDYFYTIYNAQLDRASGRPQLQTQFRLFRDGQLVTTGTPTPFDAGTQTDMKRLRAGSSIRLVSGLTPGEYVLQVIVVDMLAPEKQRTSTQWINFEIVP